MRSWMITVFLIAVIFLISPNSHAWGKKDFEWDPISPSDWDVKEDSKKGIHNAVVLLSKTIADDSDVENITLSQYRRIRILSEDGRKNGDVIVPVVGINQEIKRIYGRTVLRGGRIFELEKNQIIEKVEVKAKGYVLKRKSFSLPGVTDDCIIEYYIELHLPSLSRKFWYFQEDSYLLHGELQWKMYRGGHVTQKEYDEHVTPNWNLHPANMEIDVQRLPSPEKTREIRITVKDVPPFESEPFSMPENSLRGQINFYYGPLISPGEYWKKENKERLEDLEKFCKKDKRFKNVVNTINKLGTEEEKIRAAYDWVQKNIENTSFNPRYDEKKYKKRKTVDDVLKRGYGSNQQINIVFYDMLQKMNIDARIGAVVDRDERIFNPNAKYWQFDRLVVIVPSGQGHAKFLSPGEKHLPYGFLPWYNEGVQAFVIGDLKTQFIVCPFSTCAFNLRQRQIDLAFDNAFNLNGTGMVKHSGHYARIIRVLTSRLEEASYLEAIRNGLAHYYADAKIESISLGKIDEPTSPVEVSYKIAFSDGGQKVGSKLLIQPFKYVAETKNPFLADKRKTSILFDFASQGKDILDIVIPSGWEVEGLPSRARLLNEVGLCEVDFFVKEQKIFVQREFRVNKAYFSAKYYPAVKELFQFREELDKTTIILQQKSSI